MGRGALRWYPCPVVVCRLRMCYCGGMEHQDAVDIERARIASADGWRLYLLLALFDTRDLSPLADLVRSAREGYERAPHEDDAWAEFDRLWSSRTSAERLALARERA